MVDLVVSPPTRQPANFAMPKSGTRRDGPAPAHPWLSNSSPLPAPRKTSLPLVFCAFWGGGSKGATGHSITTNHFQVFSSRKYKVWRPSGHLLRDPEVSVSVSIPNSFLSFFFSPEKPVAFRLIFCWRLTQSTLPTRAPSPENQPNPTQSNRSLPKMATPNFEEMSQAELDFILDNVPVMQPPDDQESNFIDPPNQNGMSIAIMTICIAFVVLCLAVRVYARLILLKRIETQEYLILGAFVRWVVLC